MNFLAHFYLAAPDPDLITGGFLGDFVKGPLVGKQDLAIERGIRLHRYIDSYTDHHSAQRRIRKQLPDKLSRYSGIVTDMLCDHVLSKHWALFHQDSLTSFNQFCFEQLKSQEHQFPIKAQHTLDRMQSGEWLLNYHRLDYVLGSLTHIGKRIRFANPLHECRELVAPFVAQIEPDCLEILYDTRDIVQKWRAENMLEIVL